MEKEKEKVLCKYSKNFYCNDEVKKDGCEICLGVQARDLSFVNYQNIMLLLKNLSPKSFPTPQIIPPDVSSKIMELRGKL
jgi:hypothetical protein